MQASEVFTPTVGRLSEIFTPTTGRLCEVFTPTAVYCTIPINNLCSLAYPWCTLQVHYKADTCTLIICINRWESSVLILDSTQLVYSKIWDINTENWKHGPGSSSTGEGAFKRNICKHGEFHSTGDRAFIKAGAFIMAHGSAQDGKPGGTVYPHLKFQGVNFFLPGSPYTQAQPDASFMGGFKILWSFYLPINSISMKRVSMQYNSSKTYEETP